MFKHLKVGHLTTALIVWGPAILWFLIVRGALYLVNPGATIQETPIAQWAIGGGVAIMIGVWIYNVFAQSKKARSRGINDKVELWVNKITDTDIPYLSLAIAFLAYWLLPKIDYNDWGMHVEVISGILVVVSGGLIMWKWFLRK